MSWFRNIYQCARCDAWWSDEWSCTCDDDCPKCGARHMSPVDSYNLSEIVVQQGTDFVVLKSIDEAGHHPDYVEVGRFATRELAEAHLA